MRKSVFVLLALMLTLTACESSQRLLMSNDINAKLTKANEYYDEGKWGRANEFYQNLMPSFRGSKYFEEICYRYCYTFYNLKDYLSASYQFKNFIEAFPTSDRADECEFMYAKTMYLQAPKYTLDQTVTEKAITVLQTYINNHPNSPNLIQANQYIEICREKVETKDSKRAELYYKMEDYEAATIAYLSLIQEYPTSTNGDYYMLMRQKALYNYARQSVKSKQKERYNKSIDAYKELKDYYPESKYLQEGLALSNQASKQIEK